MDVTPTKKRVWILGAGFSRSLGGPLIGDLLTYRDRDLIESLLPEFGDSERRVALAAEGIHVRGFYAWGREEGHWEHAEDFLDKVETGWDDEVKGLGTRSHATLSLIPMLRGQARWANMTHDFPSLDALLKAARRSVLLDCWSFLRGARAKLSPSACPERWSPYLSWARNLNKNDTIVTFNYDALPDLLKQADEENAHLRVILPQNDVDHDIRVARSRGNAPVLKLHGSTTWAHRKAPSSQNVIPTTKVTPTFEFVDSQDKIPLAFTDTEVDPLLGFPGPTKMHSCQNIFAPLWAAAVDSIKDATEIIFIGYRFPPTDTYAQEEILEALASNLTVKKITTVLGEASPATERMKNLLSVVTRRQAEHVPKHIYCTDFLLQDRIDHPFTVK